jgi:hypothetical protein
MTQAKGQVTSVLLVYAATQSCAHLLRVLLL